MAIKTLRLTGTFDYQSVQDPALNTPDATVFTLRVLDSRVMGQIRDSAMALGAADDSRIDPRRSTILNVHESNFKTAQFGIVAWRNVQDADGNDVEFKTVKRVVGTTEYNVVDPELLKVLPQEVIDELALAVKDGNAVGKVEVKNSNAS
jgi:hypothetical protein